MDKKIKSFLVVFICLNILGGSLLGIRQYMREKEAKKAFENFYGESEVKGASVQKQTANPKSESMLVLEDGVAIGLFVTVCGIAYTAVRKRQLEKHHKS